MILPLITDTAAFVYQFYVTDTNTNAVLNLTIIMFRLLDVTLFCQFWQRKFFGPEKLIN